MIACSPGSRRPTASAWLARRCWAGPPAPPRPSAPPAQRALFDSPESVQFLRVLITAALFVGGARAGHCSTGCGGEGPRGVRAVVARSGTSARLAGPRGGCGGGARRGRGHARGRRRVQNPGASVQRGLGALAVDLLRPKRRSAQALNPTDTRDRPLTTVWWIHYCARTWPRELAVPWKKKRVTPWRSFL